MILFADNLKICPRVKSIDDVKKIQSNLNLLSERCLWNNLSLSRHITKCKSMVLFYRGFKIFFCCFCVYFIIFQDNFMILRVYLFRTLNLDSLEIRPLKLDLFALLKVLFVIIGMSWLSCTFLFTVDLGLRRILRTFNTFKLRHELTSYTYCNVNHVNLLNGDPFVFELCKQTKINLSYNLLCSYLNFLNHIIITVVNVYFLIICCKSLPMFFCLIAYHCTFI